MSETQNQVEVVETPIEVKTSDVVGKVVSMITPETDAGPAVGTSLAVIGKEAVTDIVNAVRSVPVMKQEDYKFLMEHNQHLGLVMEKTYMWRTPLQKKSIINDIAHPTIHSKFHQAILEQKVQFEQALYLAKDFEEKKLQVEELECDLEELEMDDSISEKRKDIKRRRIMSAIQFAQYELTNMKIQMEYRMSEVKGWQELEDDLLKEMRLQGMDEDAIWQKDYEELEDLFFRCMYNLQGINASTDGGEYNNLISLAIFVYTSAKEANCLDKYLARAAREKNNTVIEAVQFVEKYIAARDAASFERAQGTVK